MKTNHKDFTTYRFQGLCGKKRLEKDRDRKSRLEETEMEGKRMRRVKTQAQDWLYSPRRMGYRTWFYAAFVCAYACCLSAGTTLPARAPWRARVCSRTCSGWSRADSNFQPLRVVPFLCRGLVLESDPSVCIPRSTFGQTAGARLSDCHSCGWINGRRKDMCSWYLG